MGSIKPLPEAVRNTVRSAIILFDLKAFQVSVFLSVGSSYVKVVDDGSGISRDRLVPLGERYVTSKLYHLSDLDAASSSFGFRGEALASISDVALVEIITKAHGRPSGYRKVIKRSKCLYLGIDDDRKDVGTTVKLHYTSLYIDGGQTTTAVTSFAYLLLFVPCVLGVDLSYADLSEFLHQLADTDGSSTMPPSVSRILNFKACRGICLIFMAWVCRQRVSVERSSLRLRAAGV